MASEYPNSKEETPWLHAVLTRMPPRVSVPMNARARLSHRKPILLAPARSACPMPSSSQASHSTSLSDTCSAPAEADSTLSPRPASSAASPGCLGVGNTPLEFSDTISRPLEKSDPILKTDCSFQNQAVHIPSRGNEFVANDVHSTPLSIPLDSSEAASLPSAIATLQPSYGTRENDLEPQVDLAPPVDEAGGPEFRKPLDDGSSIDEKLSSPSELIGVEWGENYQRRNIEINNIKRESSLVCGVSSSVPHQLRNYLLAENYEPENWHLASEPISEKDVEEPKCLQPSISKPAKREPFADEKPSSTSAAPDFRDSEGRPPDECRSEDGQGLPTCGIVPQDVIVEQCPPFGKSLEKKCVVDESEKSLSPSGLAPGECELEEGQLSGEWSGTEEESDGSYKAPAGHNNTGSLSDVSEGNSVGPPWTRATRDQLQFPFQAIENRPEHHQKAEGKRKKHKKGEGSKKRSREKSKEKYKEVLKKRKAVKGIPSVSEGQAVRDDGCPGGTSDCGRQSHDITKQADKPERLSAKVLRIHSNELKADHRLEEGEISLEVKANTKGLLSSLVEDEVGLWTTDDVDDQLVAELAADGTVKKKRGPETAERKLKRKIAKRKKRAQKERALGRRRPQGIIQSRPVKVLCTHYMKGRCAKGDQCTFSHDAIPLTKQEPCKFLMSHSCLKGDDCPYSHDLGSFPCKFFHTRGLCFDGANCQFSHEPISEEELDKLRQRVEKEKKDRLSSASVPDIPAPTFSTPLPPDLDPDPLGWGSSISYSTLEGLQHSNPDLINRSTCLNGTDDLTSYPPAPSLGTHVSTQWLDMQSSKIDRKVSELDDLSGPTRTKAELIFGTVSADYSPLISGSREVMGSQSFAPSRIGSEALSQVSSSRAIGILNSAVSQPPPHEGSSASAVLEVSKMEEGKHVEQTVQEKSLIEGYANVLLNMEGPLRPRGSIMMPPVLGRASTRSAESGMRTGSRLIETEKILESVTQSTDIQQRTVDSLLDEALRHI